MKGFLEVLVQDVEESVCEAPHEEEDGYERHLRALDMTVTAVKSCRRTGMIDCLVVISPAPVTTWSSTLFLLVALSRASTADGRRSALVSVEETSLFPKLNLPIMDMGYRLKEALSRYEINR